MRKDSLRCLSALFLRPPPHFDPRPFFLHIFIDAPLHQIRHAVWEYISLSPTITPRADRAPLTESGSAFFFPV